MQKVFQDSMEKADKRFDEAFQLVWEGTNLGKVVSSGSDSSLTFFIPVCGQKTSWGQDLAEFIKMSWKRFSKRVRFLTEDELVPVSSTLHKSTDCKTKEIVFQGIVYQTVIYSVLEINFIINTD